MTNSVDTDHTAHLRSGSALFAKACLAENLGNYVQFSLFISLFDLMPYVHSKQLRSCQDGHPDYHVPNFLGKPPRCN